MWICGEVLCTSLRCLFPGTIFRRTMDSILRDPNPDSEVVIVETFIPQRHDEELMFKCGAPPMVVENYVPVFRDNHNNIWYPGDIANMCSKCSLRDSHENIRKKGERLRDRNSIPF